MLLKCSGAILFSIASRAQNLTCPFTVTNNFNCSVTLVWESFQPTGCSNLCINNPQYIAPPGVSSMVTGGCCNTGGDVTLYLIKVGTCVLSPNSVTLSGGVCSGSTSDSGSACGATSCGSTTWSISWTSSGIVVGP
jgi:hypothetical protein